MSRLHKFRFRRLRRKPLAGGGGSDPVEPPVDSGMVLGFSDDEVATLQTELQTGHSKAAFVQSLSALNTILGRSAPTPPTEGNYYSEDATMLASYIATICALNPEDASWASASVSFPSAIDTQEKCATLAFNLWAYSTRIGDVTDSQGRTAKALVSLMGSGNQNTFSDGDTSHPPHLWKHPCMRVSSIFWIIDKCWEHLSSGQRSDLVTAAKHVLNVGLENLPNVAHPYPKITSERGWNNQSMSYHRWLTTTGILTLLDKGVLDETEEAAVLSIEAKMRGRVTEELKMYVRQGVGAPGLHESSGSGYAGDNMCGYGRLWLWTRPIDGWDQTGIAELASTGVETLVREVFPACFLAGGAPFRGMAIPYGTNGGGHSWMEELPEEITVMMGALQRFGYTTEAAHFKWAFEQLGVPFSTYGTNTIQTTLANNSKFWGAHFWYLILGRLAEIESTPMTAFTTSKHALGFRCWNNLLDAPSHAADESGILYFFGGPDSLYYGHASIEWMVGKTVLWGYGGYVYRPTIGTGKSGFGNNGSQNAMPIILTNDRYIRSLRNLSGHPDTSVNNKDPDFELLGIKYADDPDHEHGGYVGYLSYFWHTNLVPNNQNQTEIFAFLDDKVMVEFYRWSVTNASTYRLFIPKITPTKPTFLDGAGEVKTHPGRWVSDGGRTLELVNDSGGAFSAKHYNQTQWWPDAHVKAIISWRATHSLQVQIRGYDSEYIKGAYRDQLDHQMEGTRIDERVGRSTRERVRGNAACFTREDVIDEVPANRRVYLASMIDSDGEETDVTEEALTNYNLTRLYYGDGVTAPTIRTISSYDMSTDPPSLIVTANTTIPEESPANYSLLVNQQAEFGADIESGTTDPIANGDQVRRIMGGWNIWACPTEGDAPTRNEIFCVTQVGDSRDEGFQAATVTQYEETDVTHVEIGAPVNVAVVVARDHPSMSSSASWLAGYDFLLHMADCKVTCVNLAPGSAYSISVDAEDGDYRVTLSPSGGSWVVNEHGRITFFIEGGSLVTE